MVQNYVVRRQSPRVAEQCDVIFLFSCSATRGYLETDLVILNHGQETRTTPELAPSLLTTIPYQREDILASTELTCIAPLLYGGSSVVLGSDS
ncbi:hypothetical protein TNCV_3454211 [Trichonephila clavipes]|nr:hypothetical protein TNCV_3454211 [Trichonephila clavipes]